MQCTKFLIRKAYKKKFSIKQETRTVGWGTANVEKGGEFGMNDFRRTEIMPGGYDWG